MGPTAGDALLGVAGFFASCNGAGSEEENENHRKEKRIAAEPRVNDRIHVPRVRVVASDGQQVGILETREALEMALDQDLDLVEVAAQADPPVARIMDYGKYKYEQAVRQRESRKKQTQVTVKEMKMRPKIDPHDYETKKGHVVRFLRQGSKVKVTIMFRGRETAHTDLGRKLLDRLAEDLRDIGKIETFPKLSDPRNMTMVLAPLKEAITHKPAPDQRKSPHKGGGGGGRTKEAGEEALEQAEAAPAEAPRPKRPVKVTRAEGG
ncbi:MAG: translation initiation factor IF-3 [Actinobacteria bacterium]|nr:translation initiation factor IF-3 [Actinomycetota bacterium]